MFLTYTAATAHATRTAAATAQSHAGLCRSPASQTPVPKATAARANGAGGLRKDGAAFPCEFIKLCGWDAALSHKYSCKGKTKNGRSLYRLIAGVKVRAR